MEVRIANAERLLAEYESENGEIDWDSMTIQCSSNLTWSCPNGEVAQQHLKRIGITSSLEPLDVTAHRGNEVSGDYFMSTLAAGMDFDDPNDTFGQWFITNGGRWYQRRSIPELDEIFNQQKGEGDFDSPRVGLGDGPDCDERRLVHDSAMVAGQLRQVGFSQRHHGNGQSSDDQRQIEVHVAGPAGGQPDQPIANPRVSADVLADTQPSGARWL